MAKPLNLTGQRFGKLLVTHQGASDQGTRWWCICDCGNKTIIPGTHLNQGLVKSCGCEKKKWGQKISAQKRTFAKNFRAFQRRTMGK